ncbi:hypothetical protein BGX24_001908 [Mortierella sp. AD032]|nr:hypothetical protein BGX24_001908 [Mortierella sp. AD032]
MSRASDFQLLDNQNNAVKSNKDYFLSLANPSLEGDVLSFQYSLLLHATADHKALKVMCEFIDGILYLKYNHKFLYINDDGEIALMDEVPKTHERLRLVVSDKDSTFLISRWDRNNVAELEWIKCAYGQIKINERYEGNFGMKLILNPV